MEQHKGTLSFVNFMFDQNFYAHYKVSFYQHVKVRSEMAKKVIGGTAAFIVHLTCIKCILFIKSNTPAPMFDKIFLLKSTIQNKDYYKIYCFKQ